MGTRNSMRTRPEPWLVILIISPLRGPRRSMTVPTKFSGTSMVRCSTGSMSLPSMSLGDDLGPADHELEAFAAHHLDEDGELKFAAAEDLEAVRRAGLFHADGDVGEQFLVEALAQIAAR